MRKGQKVRIKSSGKIGMIADSEFFYWNHRKHVRYEVKVKGQNTTCWYPKEDLTTDLVERATVVFSGETGTMSVEFSLHGDREKNYSLNSKLTCNPDNLQEHNGLHVFLFNMLIKELSSNS